MHSMASGAAVLEVLGLAAAVVGTVGYLWLVTASRERGWPAGRTVSWLGGTLLGLAAVTGPLAAAAQTSYVAHMAAHLLLGMAAPVLLVLGAPVTLLLRALPVPAARRVSAVLSSRPVRVLTEPGVAAVLDVGALWLLYTTGLYPAMHRHAWLHVVVHVHMLSAGYLFSAAIVSVDPMPHRRGYPHRALVLVLALAAHDILAKLLYAGPPEGVAPAAGRTGAMLMYYGGDAVDLALIVLLCARWYRSTRPRAHRADPTPAPAATDLLAAHRRVNTSAPWPRSNDIVTTSRVFPEAAPGRQEISR
ncbi:hypothetical protein GCM10009593_17350 [Microlunatus antarcticus]